MQGVVPATTVDAFLRYLRSDEAVADVGGLPAGSPPAEVLFMKVDVEGADYAVLRGARAALASGRVQALQFESNFKWEKMVGAKTLVDGVRFLEQLGYDVFLISRTGPWQPISGAFWDAAYEGCAETWDSTNVAAVRARPPVPWMPQFRAWAMGGGDLVCPKGR